MKKKKGNRARITPELALEFLEEMNQLQAAKDKPTKAISLRVPGNILNAYKMKAQAESRPYQAMMIQALREFILASTTKI